MKKRISPQIAISFGNMQRQEQWEPQTNTMLAAGYHLLLFVGIGCPPTFFNSGENMLETLPAIS
jgi:hypothetical protein